MSKIFQKISKSCNKFPFVAMGRQKFSKLGKSSQKLPKVAKRYQKFPKVVRVQRHLQSRNPRVLLMGVGAKDIAKNMKIQVYFQKYIPERIFVFHTSLIRGSNLWLGNS